MGVTRSLHVVNCTKVWLGGLDERIHPESSSSSWVICVSCVSSKPNR